MSREDEPASDDAFDGPEHDSSGTEDDAHSGESTQPNNAAENTPDEDDSSSVNGIAIGLPIGMAVGVAIGSATDNLALWIAIGLIFGISFGQIFTSSKGKE